MSEKKTVKVIKKGERQAKPQSVSNSAADTARKMVKNVTNWVNEVQNKRRVETANALKILSKTPRPSEI